MEFSRNTPVARPQVAWLCLACAAFAPAASAQVAADGAIQPLLTYTSEDLSNIAGGNKRTSAHAGQLTFGASFDLHRLWGWPGASAQVAFTHRDGQSLDEKAGIGALMGTHEIYGRGQTTRLTRLWLDQTLAAGRVSLRVGRLNPGSDFQAVDCAFINLSFCGNQAGNVAGDYWTNAPMSQWGITGRWNVSSGVYLKIGAYQVNPRYQRHGARLALAPRGTQGTLTPLELGWEHTAADLRTSRVMLGGWYSSAPRHDVWLDEQGAVSALSGRDPALRTGAYGGYLSAAQDFNLHLAAGQQRLRVYLNGTLVDRRTSTVDRTLALGASLKGFALRPEDELGVSIASSHLNSRASLDRRLRRTAGQLGLPPGNDEYAVEIYYRVSVGAHLSISPDIQWIRRPGGASERADVVVVGARTSIAF